MEDLLKNIDSLKKTTERLKKELQNVQASTSHSIDSLEDGNMKDMLRKANAEAQRGTLDITNFIDAMRKASQKTNKK